MAAAGPGLHAESISVAIQSEFIRSPGRDFSALPPASPVARARFAGVHPKVCPGLGRTELAACRGGLIPEQLRRAHGCSDCSVGIPALAQGAQRGPIQDAPQRGWAALTRLRRIGACSAFTL